MIRDSSWARADFLLAYDSNIFSKNLASFQSAREAKSFKHTCQNMKSIPFEFVRTIQSPLPLTVPAVLAPFASPSVQQSKSFGLWTELWQTLFHVHQSLSISGVRYLKASAWHSVERQGPSKNTLRYRSPKQKFLKMETSLQSSLKNEKKF